MILSLDFATDCGYLKAYRMKSWMTTQLEHMYDVMWQVN